MQCDSSQIKKKKVCDKARNEHTALSDGGRVSDFPFQHVMEEQNWEIN